jgi:hypothetical protein
MANARRSLQLSTIQAHIVQFDYPGVPASADEEASLLKNIGRLVHDTIKVAFLEVAEQSGRSQFAYLLSLVYRPNRESNICTFGVRIVCHVTPFVRAFADQFRAVLSDTNVMERPEIAVRCRYTWAENIPYRISTPGPNVVLVECMDDSAVVLRFPLRTSDLLWVFASMATGKLVIHDDLRLDDPVQAGFLWYMRYVMKRRSFSFLDVELDPHDPEKWMLPLGGSGSLAEEAS